MLGSIGGVKPDGSVAAQKMQSIECSAIDTHRSLQSFSKSSCAYVVRLSPLPSDDWQLLMTQLIEDSKSPKYGSKHRL